MTWHSTTLQTYEQINDLLLSRAAVQTSSSQQFLFFQVRLSRAFLISLKDLLTIIKQIVLFNPMFSLQYFLVLEYEHSHLQYSTVCSNITFRISKRRFTCARSVSTWKVPPAVSSSIILVWLKKDTKTNSFWIFFSCIVKNTVEKKG